ncbi:MAG TPA: hypothetical protein VFO44_15125 [Steroidobacteraceae bacterium]|nr:hypothetical protein [Steroidobacteraceae bacterium]
MRTRIALGTACRILAVSMLFMDGLHAQMPPEQAQPRVSAEYILDQMAMSARLDKQLQSALAGRAYDGLDSLEKRAVVLMAENAIKIVAAGECADATAQPANAEGFLAMFTGPGRHVFKPIFDLPTARKTELVDKAMEIASQPRDAEFIDTICQTQLAAAWSVKPIAERRQVARQVLLMALSPPAPVTIEARIATP